jgi:iron complex transport system permease protein
MQISITRLSAQRVAWLAVVLLIAAFLLAVATGAVPISLADTLDSLFNLKLSSSSQMAAEHQLIIWQLRLPRALLAACVGAMLAMSGAAMQGLFRNPLADPSLIGVTAGAVAGAGIMIVMGGALLDYLYVESNASNRLFEVGQIALVSLGAFVGGGIAVALVYRLSTSSSGTSVSTMLLAGIAITALAGSLSSLLEYAADNEMLRRISLWRMGGFEGATWLRVGLAAFICSILLWRLPRYAQDLNVLLLGESEARHLGVDIQRVKQQLVLLVAIAVGISVALAGAIAFVGLVVPHIMRLLVGPDHKTLLPLSAISGAILLLLADSISRTAVAPAELPVGVITAVLGAPFFIILLRHRHEYGMR